MNTTIDFLKKKQRDLLIKKRYKLNDSVNLENNNFFEILKEKEWFDKSKIIASFMSIKSEIPTKRFNEFIEKMEKIICLPVMVDSLFPPLVFKLYTKEKNLKKGKFGVLEPVGSKSYIPDIIFTPCLAFDLEGNRLGYGGGYYDKTISHIKLLNNNLLTIGLAYDKQKIDYVEHDDFDQKLNYILTEKQLYKV